MKGEKQWNKELKIHFHCSRYRICYAPTPGLSSSSLDVHASPKNLLYTKTRNFVLCRKYVAVGVFFLWALLVSYIFAIVSSTKVQYYFIIYIPSSPPPQKIWILMNSLKNERSPKQSFSTRSCRSQSTARNSSGGQQKGGGAARRRAAEATVWVLGLSVCFQPRCTHNSQAKKRRLS